MFPIDFLFLENSLMITIYIRAFARFYILIFVNFHFFKNLFFIIKFLFFNIFYILVFHLFIHIFFLNIFLINFLRLNIADIFKILFFIIIVQSFEALFYILSKDTQFPN